MFKNLELVILDMDGLMFDTERVYMKVVIEALEALNIEFDLATLYSSLGTTQFDMNTVLTGNIPEGFDFPKLIKEVHEKAVEDLCTNGVPKKPGLDELLELLEEKAYKLAIASSTQKERCFAYLNSLNFTDKFEVILTGNDVENIKPHPDLFLKACQLVNVPTERALVLEDSMNGAIAASRANIKCILIPDIVAPTLEIKELLYCVLNDLNDVAKLLF